jgi:hypothetical protein
MSKEEAIRRQKQSIKDKMLNNNGKIAPNNLLGRDVDLMKQLRQIKLGEYIYGSLHPKFAVEHHLDVKLPTDLPIPSYTIRTTKTYAITTPVTGTLFVNYAPGSLLGTNISNGTASALTVNTTCDGVSVAGTNSFVDLGFADIIQAHDKWRLVACEARISYNGPLLNRSGTCYSCVHYERPYIAYKGASGTGTIASQSNSQVDKFSGNFQLIKQGLWNQKTNIAEHGEGISHLWTPTSYDDYAFPGYSSTVSTSFSGLIGNTSFNPTNTQSATTVSSSTSNAVRQFAWAFTNMPVSSNCLLFEVYEIYEAIPDSSALSIVSVSDEYMDSTAHMILKETLANKPELMHPDTPIYNNKKTFMSKIVDTVKGITKSLDWGSLASMFVKALV